MVPEKYLMSIFLSSLIFSAATAFVYGTDTQYRSLLNETDGKIYDAIVQHIENKNTQTLQMSSTIRYEELLKVLECVMNDHPEYYWLASTFRYKSYNGSGVVTSVTFDYLKEVEGDYNSVIDKVVQEASKYTTFEDHIKCVQEYIMINTTYEDNVLSNSSYGALVNHKAVCSGYAKAFQDICKHLGYDCIYVTGEALNQYHAWNIIKDDNGDLHCFDVTWDDARDSLCSFNVPLEVMNRTHTLSELSQQLINKEVK